MRILLDENFPLPLHHRLRDAGYEVDHIIVLGQRGLGDSAIRHRLESEDLLFLTNDTEFFAGSSRYHSVVIVSRVRQNRPLRDRVELWFQSLAHFVAAKPSGTIFELLDTGEIVPWVVIENG